MRCPFGFATLQRSRLRLVKKLTGEFMRVNKLDFLKENTLFRNGKSKEELLRNTTTVSTAENRELTAEKLCFVGKLWFYQGHEQADGRIQLFSRGLSWYVRRGCLHGGSKILHSNNYRFDC